MAALTLHEGDSQREFVQHPMEVARRALRDAADLESTTGHDDWAAILRRVASAMPERRPTRKAVA
jgi:hypothetical protein